MIVRLVTVRTVTVLITFTVRVIFVVTAADPSGTTRSAAISVVLKTLVLNRMSVPAWRSDNLAMGVAVPGCVELPVSPV